MRPAVLHQPHLPALATSPARPSLLPVIAPTATLPCPLLPPAARQALQRRRVLRQREQRAQLLAALGVHGGVGGLGAGRRWK